MARRYPTALIATLALATGCTTLPTLRAPGAAKAATASSPAPGAAPKATPRAPSGGGLVAPNAGSLTGVVLGPAARLIANNGGSIISNNGGGIISNNGAGYRLQQAAAYAPVAAARVEVLDSAGASVVDGPVTTTSDGRFVVERLKASGPWLFVRVTYRLAERDVAMAALVSAPRSPGARESKVTPATTLIAAKAQSALAADRQAERDLAPAPLARLAEQLDATLSERMVAEALLLPAREAAGTYDRLLAGRPELARLAADAAGPAMAKPATPTLAPSPAASPAAAGSATPSPTPAPASAQPSPTPTPWPAVGYQIRRVAGSAQGGMAAGTDRLSATFMSIAGLVQTPADALILADPDANQIRRLPASGAAQLIAGQASGAGGYDASTNATATRLNQPHGLAYDAAAGDVYVCDTGNHRVRRLAGGVLTTLVGGGADAAETVAVATNAQLGSPMGLARDTDGNLYFTERDTARVRRYDAAGGGLRTIATGVGNGALALDRANGLLWVARDGVVTALSGIGAASATVVTPSVLTVPAGAAAPVVTGLAYNGAGLLYVALATGAAGNPAEAQIVRVRVDGTGRATGVPERVAGTRGQSASAADYSVPTTSGDGLLQLLGAPKVGGLCVGADGALYAGNAVPGAWGQVLRLTPVP